MNVVRKETITVSMNDSSPVKKSGVGVCVCSI